MAVAARPQYRLSLLRSRLRQRAHERARRVAHLTVPYLPMAWAGGHRRADRRERERDV